ncbi:MAG: hypothetical protein MI747_18000, partial [Desulfobacterales bacterium]|nr:hypothetical protein [Desulfobacterales bacterium]
GRHALLVDYFKPLEVVDRTGRPFHLERLTDLQVETLLLDTGTLDISPPGMRNLKEFFTIYDQGPCRRRRKMSPAVLKGLKKKELAGKRYAQLPDAAKLDYRRKIQTHFDFCNLEKLRTYRLNAAAFFLEAARDYLQGRDAEKEMIRFLTHGEFQKLGYEFEVEIPALETLAGETEESFFSRLRFYLLCLVRERKQKEIQAFIHRFRAHYDPVTDVFLPDTRE